MNIFAQNLAQRLKKTPRKQFYLQISLIQDGGGRHFENWFNGYISVAMALYLNEILHRDQKTILNQPFCRQNSIPTKSKMAAVAILKFFFNGHTSVTVEHMPTKFGTETKNEVPKSVLPSDFTSQKIQDGGNLHIFAVVYL